MQVVLTLLLYVYRNSISISNKISSLWVTAGCVECVDVVRRPYVSDGIAAFYWQL